MTCCVRERSAKIRPIVRRSEDGKMLMHLLAVPLGIVVFIAILFIAALIATYLKETLLIVFVVLIGYWLGANILGLFN